MAAYPSTRLHARTRLPMQRGVPPPACQTDTRKSKTELKTRVLNMRQSCFKFGMGVDNTKLLTFDRKFSIYNTMCWCASRTSRRR